MGAFEMEAELNSEQQAIIATAEKFAMEFLRPAGVELDKRTPGYESKAANPLSSIKASA